MTDNTGITPAMNAANTGNIEMIELFLKTNADFTLRDNEGWTAFDWSFPSGYYKKLSGDFFPLFELFYQYKNRLSEEDRKWMEEQKIKALLRK